jgi:hypothetical protein
MVADLKRGGSFRGHHEPPVAVRRGSVLGLGSTEVAEDEEERIGERLDRRRATTEEQPRPTQGRGRSLSGTLGELWRGLRSVDNETEGSEGLGRRQSER